MRGIICSNRLQFSEMHSIIVRMDESERLARREYARHWRAQNLDKERERVRLNAAARRSQDRDAYNASMRAWRHEHPDKVREYQKRSKDKHRLARNAYMREWHRKNRERVWMNLLARKHGVPADTLMTMLEAQGRCCAICQRPESTRALHLDHDHATGRIRAFLCARCNAILGFAGDSGELLQEAFAFLRKHHRTAEEGS